MLTSRISRHFIFFLLFLISPIIPIVYRTYKAIKESIGTGHYTDIGHRVVRIFDFILVLVVGITAFFLLTLSFKFPVGVFAYQWFVTGSFGLAGYFYGLSIVTELYGRSREWIIYYLNKKGQGTK